jgi:hypothetical protein
VLDLFVELDALATHLSSALARAATIDRHPEDGGTGQIVQRGLIGKLLNLNWTRLSGWMLATRSKRLFDAVVRSELNRFPRPTGSTVATITAPASAIIGD